MAGSTIAGIDAAALANVQITDVSMNGKQETAFHFQLKSDALSNLGSIQDAGKTKALQEAYEKENGIDPSIKGKIQMKKAEKEVECNDTAVAEKITEKGEEIKSEIAEKLGISEEDVEDAMETLGISLVDLFDPAKLATLYLQLQGVENIDLITDDFLYQGIQDVMDILERAVQELSEELGISLEAVEQLVTNDEMKALVSEATETLEAIEPEIIHEDKPVIEVEVKEANTEYEQIDVKDYAVNEKTQIEEGESEEQNLQQDTDRTQIKMPEKGKGDEEEATAPHVMHQTVEHHDVTNAPVTESVAELPESFLSEETKSIMDQMMESMKAEITPEVTELKLMLHPESLGNVHVTLTAKEGAVAAQFTAQNETVKNILETQMIQLKETLQEKGVQVTEVEVTVETGAFNRQYSEQEQSESEKAFEKEVKQLRSRHINLLEDMEEEELDEADALTAKIMKENGNSLDYMA